MHISKRKRIFLILLEDRLENGSGRTRENALSLRDAIKRTKVERYNNDENSRVYATISKSLNSSVFDHVERMEFGKNKRVVDSTESKAITNNGNSTTSAISSSYQRIKRALREIKSNHIEYRTRDNKTTCKLNKSDEMDINVVDNQNSITPQLQKSDNNHDICIYSSVKTNNEKDDTMFYNPYYMPQHWQTESISLEKKPEKNPYKSNIRLCKYKHYRSVNPYKPSRHKSTLDEDDFEDYAYHIYTQMQERRKTQTNQIEYRDYLNEYVNWRVTTTTTITTLPSQ